MPLALPTGSRVAVDTAVLIYFLAGDSLRAPLVLDLLTRAVQGELELVVSAVTEAELLVAPFRQPDPLAAARRVQDLLSAGRGVTVVDVTRAIARRAAQLRASWELRLADALVAATAVEKECVALVSNDKHFQRLQLPGIAYLHLDAALA